MTALDDWYIVFWLAGSASLLVVSSAAVYAWCAYRRKQSEASLESGIRSPTRASLAVVTTAERQALLDSAPPSPLAYHFEPNACYSPQSPTFSISQSMPIRRYGTVPSVTQATSLARDAALGPLPYVHGAINAEHLVASVPSERQSLVRSAEIDPLVRDSALQSPASGAQVLIKQGSPATSLQTPESSVNHVDFQELPPSVPRSSSPGDLCSNDAAPLAPSEQGAHNEPHPELMTTTIVAVSPGGSSKTGALSFVASVDSISTISDRTSHQGSPPNLPNSRQPVTNATLAGVSVPETVCASARTPSYAAYAFSWAHDTPVAVPYQIDPSMDQCGMTKTRAQTKEKNCDKEQRQWDEANAKESSGDKNTIELDWKKSPETPTPDNPGSPPVKSRTSRRRANKRKRRNQVSTTSPHSPSASSSQSQSPSPPSQPPVSMNFGVSLPDAERPFMVKPSTNPRTRALTIGDYRDTQWTLTQNLDPPAKAQEATPDQKITAPTSPQAPKSKARQRSMTLPLTNIPDPPIDLNACKMAGTRELTVDTDYSTLETEKEKIAYTELLIESSIKTLERQAKKSNKEPTKRTAKRCKFWPTCNSSSCKYRHPNRKCWNCLDCRRPNCMYIHYGDVPTMYTRLRDKMFRQSNHYSRLSKARQSKSQSLDLPRPESRPVS
ncbi:hypothetical protein H4R34_002813 [Dimargaris verticillata]|uniref:Uncharacterized protein n=1 Tax=Dimargaris verticillata TaxID=2761393 RepID=A0A9W8E8W7_9FUNG|nr:hypothetical protein H4R34_002813 [Dimargaris verticillata]